MDIKKLIENQVIVVDGAMGTMLQTKGLKTGEIPETLNITAPEIVQEIHQGYLRAGANILTTNTFGANHLKLQNSGFTVEEIIEAAINNCKKAVQNHQGLIALDIGPLGELLEPMGTLTFEQAYDLFKQQVLQGVKSGVDLVIIETMTDLYEAKAAVLAVKENSELPVFCTMSFEENMRTFTGCSVEAMVMVLQGLGVDALGVNCSLGPKELEPLIDKVLEISKVPVIVQANAGLPKVENGKTYFDLSPAEFSDYAYKFAQKNVAIIGGCCGTTYDHIKALAQKTKNITLQRRTPKVVSQVCTPTKTVTIDGVRIIGERINPTGKKNFKIALQSGNIDYVLQEAVQQMQAGADILDVNVGLPEINESEIMGQVISEIQAILDIPLQIDSNDPVVIEKGLRVYNGKAIVNSVTGEDHILDTILPIVKKYGAAVIGLTLDEQGIPTQAEARFKIAEKIVERALAHGIAKEDIYIDCLTLTAAAQQDAVMETIKAIQLVKENLQVKTTLGVSNISFGLPKRDIINRTFLASSLTAGLDLPIINPLDQDMMDTIKAFRVLSSEDLGAKTYLEQFTKRKNIITVEQQVKYELHDVIIQGNKELAEPITKQLIAKKDPLAIINQDIIPALDIVGQQYEEGEIFLPQLIQAAETVKTAFKTIQAKIGPENDLQLAKGKIVLATVKGDVHDIGKNIVKVLLESYGFQVIDLGKDVASETIVEAVIKHQVKLVGLSALMTTTVNSMETTIRAIKSVAPDCKVMVGGAVLNPDYAAMINADFYGKDAKAAIAIAQKIYGE